MRLVWFSPLLLLAACSPVSGSRSLVSVTLSGPDSPVLPGETLSLKLSLKSDPEAPARPDAVRLEGLSSFSEVSVKAGAVALSCTPAKAALSCALPAGTGDYDLTLSVRSLTARASGSATTSEAVVCAAGEKGGAVLGERVCRTVKLGLASNGLAPTLSWAVLPQAGGTAQLSVGVSSDARVPVGAATVSLKLSQGLQPGAVLPVNNGWKCTAGTELVCVNTAELAGSTPSSFLLPVEVDRSLENAGSESCLEVLSLDRTPDDNRICLTQKVAPAARNYALELTAAQPGGAALPGESGLLDLSVTNTGPDPIPAFLGAVTLEGSLAVGAELDLAGLASQSAGSAWNCSSSSVSKLSCRFLGTEAFPVGTKLNLKVPYRLTTPAGLSVCLTPLVGTVAGKASCLSRVPLDYAAGLSWTPAPGLRVGVNSILALKLVASGRDVNSSSTPPLDVQVELPLEAALDLGALKQKNSFFDCSSSNQGVLSCRFEGPLSRLPSTLSVPLRYTALPAAGSGALCATLTLPGDSTPGDNSACLDLAVLTRDVSLSAELSAPRAFVVGVEGQITVRLKNAGKDAPLPGDLPITVTAILPPEIRLNPARLGSLNPSFDCSGSNVGLLKCTLTPSSPSGVWPSLTLPITSSAEIDSLCVGVSFKSTLQTPSVACVNLQFARYDAVPTLSVPNLSASGGTVSAGLKNLGPDTLQLNSTRPVLSGEVRGDLSLDGEKLRDLNLELWDCSSSGKKFSCEYGALDPLPQGASWILSVPVAGKAGAQGSVCVTVAVVGDRRIQNNTLCRDLALPPVVGVPQSFR